jgi:glycerol-3-phosphate dehydrogenase
MNRQETLQHLRDHPDLSVLIVGGGINGIGTFRDLTLQGLDVLLVERADFCSGASAASSHMAHGGIRYLENGEFRLVREAVQERNRLIENAPHIVRPLPTTIPIFKWFSGLFNAPFKFLNLLDRPSERGAVVIKAGLMLYDAYTGKQGTVPRHQFHWRKETLERYPRLSPEILCSATYYDGAILSPERLAVELLLDAEAENPNAHSLNYTSLVGSSGDAVTLRDELSGETFEVRPRLLINAAGPWIDIINHDLGLTTNFIGGTKGSHLVLDHQELRQAIGDHEFFFENKDGRIVLIFPLFDKVLIGTSDIPVENPDDVGCTEEEVDYFLGLVARVFPDIEVARAQIVFRFSGVRPLAYSHAKTAGQITRDHEIRVVDGVWTGLKFPVYSLVGGKWTSFRAFSEQVTDKALEFLNLPRQKDTAVLPIGGGRGYPKSPEDHKRTLEGLRAWTGFSLERLSELFDRYGMRVDQVALFISQGEDQPLKSLPDYSQREIGFLAHNEKIVHLDDLLLRRSMLAMLGRLTHERIVELANILGVALDWNAKQKRTEVELAVKLLEDKHGLNL